MNTHYERGLLWIAHHRGGHNGKWPPREVRDCIGWGCIRQLAFVHDIEAWSVAADLIEYLDRSEKGFRQP